MPRCLIALGSNLGDRRRLLRDAMLALAELPATMLLARSSWHETNPLGGPRGQEPFLNAAVLVDANLPPERLLAELLAIERRFGRVVGKRWAPRVLDLDLLLYGGLRLQSPTLQTPHPRLVFRRFALEPAAEIAAEMVHPESGWTIGRLLAHLDAAPDVVAVVGEDSIACQGLVDAVARVSAPNAAVGKGAPPTIVPWNEWSQGRAWTSPGFSLPKLVLALRSSAGTDLGKLRTILNLPFRGPVAWIGGDAELSPLDEATAAIRSVWPALERTPT